MADSSFFVHLQSLYDFASELQTQLTGMTAPVDRLDQPGPDTRCCSATSARRHVLGASHQAAIAEMSELLGQVQQAIDFAENVTNTVATGYQQADQDVAGGMQVKDTSSVPAVQPVARACGRAVYGSLPDPTQSGGTPT